MQGRVLGFRGSNKEEQKKLAREDPRPARDVSERPSGSGFKSFSRPGRFGAAKRRDIDRIRARMDKRKQLFEEGKCYICKQEGHKFYDRPKRKKTDALASKGIDAGKGDKRDDASV